ncbi:hypothetical protein [Psychromonas sp. KJ10-2]|uniref:hypothetical protein n=1 Tax=Psychromonas sp. KJ10-2 TaxID=3391822 RepID=UPI0039B5A3BD
MSALDGLFTSQAPKMNFKRRGEYQALFSFMNERIKSLSSGELVVNNQTKLKDGEVLALKQAMIHVAENNRNYALYTICANGNEQIKVYLSKYEMLIIGEDELLVIHPKTICNDGCLCSCCKDRVKPVDYDIYESFGDVFLNFTQYDKDQVMIYSTSEGGKYGLNLFNRLVLTVTEAFSICNKSKFSWPLDECPLHKFSDLNNPLSLIA